MRLSNQAAQARSGQSLAVLCSLLAFYAVAVGASAQTITRLHSFDITDGADPLGSLVQATDGNLYGTTNAGGAYNNGNCYPKNVGCGSAFKITPTGKLVTLYSFCAQTDCSDGANPQGGLVQGSDGNLYGTTYGGGAFGTGTVFRLSLAGELTTIYNFCSQANCGDGVAPVSRLVQGQDGDLYGTAQGGGINPADQNCYTFSFGCGTIFKVTLDGMFTTLYTFCSEVDCTDGANPAAGVVQGSDGNFYGTTVAGGANLNCVALYGLPGCGTVFKVTPTGALSTLYSFCSEANCADGAAPSDAVVQGSNGSFYGTTFGGGSDSFGTVFSIARSGLLTTLHSFKDEDDGADPYGITQGSDGSFYGTTSVYPGTVYKITPAGLLVTFPLDGTDGDAPIASVTQDTNGNFYGTASAGGSDDDGTVFELSVGLRPFIETQPAAASVGQTVKILGTALTGATSVTFNGVAATFTVVSPSLIKTSVPQGATTGKLTVVGPSGTLTSNVNFRVLR